MERRASTRWPLNIKSLLSGPEITPQPCVISDLGEEGLGIRHDPALSKVLSQSGYPDSDKVAMLSFSHPDQPAKQVLPVKVVRASDGQVGALLMEAPAGVESALKRLHKQDGKMADVIMDPQARHQILQQCLYCLQQSLSPLFDQFLEELPQAVTQAADASAKESVRTAFLDSLISIRNHSGRIVRLFRQELAESLTGEGERETEIQGQLLAPEVSPEEKQEFESWLTLKVMVTKAETLYRAELLILKMRLDRIGIVSTLGYQNPLGPQLIGHAFRKTMEPMRLPQVAEKLCYRLFEKAVLKQLAPLYSQLNQLLVQYGVLPDLDLSRYLSQCQDTPQTMPRDEAKHPAELQLLKAKGGGGSSDRSETFVKKLQAVQGVGKGVQKRFPGRVFAVPAASAGLRSVEVKPFRAAKSLLEILGHQLQGHDSLPSSGSYWSVEIVQGALVRMQKQRLRHTPPSDEAPLKNMLVESLRKTVGTDAGAGLCPLQQEGLDLVGAFVRSLMSLPALNDTVRTTLWRLEIPLYGFYQRDPQLFGKPQSPILQVISHIVWLERYGWRPERYHQPSLEQVVGGLCEEVEPEDAVVEQCLKRLVEILEWQKGRFQRNQERAVAAAEGMRKVDESRQVVAREIALRTAGKRVPKVVLKLINGGWQELMSLTFIRQGPDSSDWRQHLAVLDLLVNTGEGGLSEQNPETVVKQIEMSLRAISAEPVAIEKLCDELRELLRSSGEAEYVQMPAGRSSVSVEEAPSEAERRADLHPWLARVLKLRVGDWFRVKRGDSRDEYVRLARIGKSFSRFLFVNRFGQKVADWEAVQLAQRMRQNLIVPEPEYERAAAESALELMVGNIYQQIARKTGKQIVAPVGGSGASPGAAVTLREKPDFSDVLLRGQKIIPLTSRSKFPVQYQILLSIFNTQGQLMNTGDYVKAVEDRGWAQALDRWVLEKVLGWMSQNVSRLKTIDSLCISLSGKSIQDEGLLEFVYEHLARSDVPLEKICFDISEADARDDIQGVTDFMRELREYGCRFCLSHVDPTLSNFDMIRHLPLDFVKFDGSLMIRLMQEPQARKLCMALVEVVHLFDCELIAGQVESRSGLDLLKTLGVDYAQGYGVERPCLLSAL